MDQNIDDGQYPDNNEFVPYVTGANLASKSGAKVTLWGKVTNVSNEGFSVKTVDDLEVLVKLDSPLSEPLEGWYEIHGVSQGKWLRCEEYVPFTAEMTKDVDFESHKALAKLLSALDDPWDLGPN